MTLLDDYIARQKPAGRSRKKRAKGAASYSYNRDLVFRMPIKIDRREGRGARMQVVDLNAPPPLDEEQEFQSYLGAQRRIARVSHVFVSASDGLGLQKALTAWRTRKAAESAAWLASFATGIIGAT